MISPHCHLQAEPGLHRLLKPSDTSDHEQNGSAASPAPHPSPLRVQRLIVEPLQATLSSLVALVGSSGQPVDQQQPDATPACAAAHRNLALTALLGLVTASCAPAAAQGAVAGALPPRALVSAMPLEGLFANVVFRAITAVTGRDADERVLHARLTDDAGAGLVLAITQMLVVADAASMMAHHPRLLRALVTLLAQLREIRSTTSRAKEALVSTDAFAAAAADRASDQSSGTTLRGGDAAMLTDGAASVPAPSRSARDAGAPFPEELAVAAAPLDPADAGVTRRVTTQVLDLNRTHHLHTTGAPGTAQDAAYGYLACGTRSLPALLRTRALRCVAALLGALVTGHDEATAVLLGVLDDAFSPLQRFVSLYDPDTHRDGGRKRADNTLSHALLEDVFGSLYLLRVLARHRGAWLLYAPASFTRTRALLCGVLRCVALLPFDGGRVAQLSCRTTDPQEAARDRDNGSSRASERLLKVDVGWFWVTGVARAGPHVGAFLVHLCRRSAH